MPRKCCVPECKSNYTSVISIEGAKSTFSFLKDAQLLKEWLCAFPRKDRVPTKHSAVCSDHFSPQEIETEEIFTDSDGQVFKHQLQCPRLIEGAVPYIYKNLPSYLSKTTPLPRSKPEKRRERAEKLHEEQVSKFLNSDMIGTFDDFADKFREKLQDNKWQYRLKCRKRVYFYLLNLDAKSGDSESNGDIENNSNGECEGYVKVINSVIVNEDLSVQVYAKGHLLRHEDLSWILSSDLKLSSLN